MPRRLCSLSLAVFFIATGCGGPAESTADASLRHGSLALSTCSFDVPRDVSALRAHRNGLVIARDGVVHRMHGAGCKLEPSGAPVAAEVLLDVDDEGVLYVFPSEAAEQSDVSTISTMLPGEYRESMVARVEAHASSIGEVEKLLDAGRGIWGFGVSPAGDALWVSACGPSGLFDVTPPTSVEASSSLEVPATLWGSVPAVLTNRDTFWSVGAWTCDPTEHSPSDPAQLTDACGYALVRTTPEGSTEVASTVIDFGAGGGFEHGALARCGANVCGVFTSAVVIWSEDGEVIELFDHVAIDVWRGEHIAGVTGNDHGLYVLLRSVGASRVVFLPR